MQIAQKLAGFSLAKADLLRRAMGKKIKSEMKAQKRTLLKDVKKILLKRILLKTYIMKLKNLLDMVLIKVMLQRMH